MTELFVLKHRGIKGREMTEQPQPTDSGLAALILVAGYHGIAVDAGKIIHEQAALGERLKGPDLDC